ncbi:two component transcriptional regulator, LuxR family [Shewanella baltica OS195]|uniref:Two component transcriptional regulator, LuxR family n=1 Tax=Shewanella baltica (strain OS195) TaxID=399599 RepID=A9L1Z6_SHEB9|nr:two component system response regulator [Shewanella baltica]ABX49414.1 two component transcriptional regulator, LuxR family [Shewanella baltica OS195]ADT94410.1 two component transcriptional regulator, LuxR family [Shewanella baltica OS678]
MAFSHGKVINILVVDDHSLIFDGLRGCLAPYPELNLIGSVEDGLAVYEKCLKLRPDLVFMDLKLPGMGGLDVIRQLRQRWPEMMIIMLTGTIEEKSAREALDVGANGYVLKNSPKSTLLAAIKCVSKGKNFIDPSLDEQQIDALSGVVDGDIPLLTPREQQVLKLICEGRRNRDIAEDLVIGLKTVETHRMNLMRKLNAHNVAELMHWVQRLGL